MLKNAFLLFAFALVVLAAFLPSFTRWQDVKERDRGYQRQIEHLASENTRLKEEQRLLEDDPAYLEKVAREKMGLIREGEVIFHLTTQDDLEYDKR